MSGITDDWDSIPVSDTPSKSNSLTADWDAVPVRSPQTKTLSPGAQQKQRIIDDVGQMGKDIAGGNIAAPGIGVAQGIGNIVSGIGSSIVGGWRGLTSLAMGNGVDDAANTVRQTQDESTYHPTSAAGKLVSEVASVPMNVIKTGTSSIGGDVGQAMGGTKGRIAGEAIGDVAPDIAATLSGARFALGKEIPPPIVPMSVADRVEPTLGAKPGTPDVQTAAPVEITAPALNNASSAVKQYVENNTNLSDAEIQRHVEADSLPIPARLTAGQASQDIHKISFEQNNRGKNPTLGNMLNDQNQNLIDNINHVREKAAPDVNVSNHVEAGQALVDSYKNMDSKLKSDISQKYQALKDANGGQFPLDAPTFVDNADKALHQDLLYDHVPPAIRNTMNRLKDGGTMSFENFEALRTNLARLQRSPSVDGNAQAAAGVIRNALEDMPMPTGAEHLKPLADQARAAARARFQLIDSDPAYKAVTNDDSGIGEPSPLADKFIESYVINGKRANVQNMVKNIGDDPAAKQTIAAGTLDYLKSNAGVDLRTNTGNVSQSAYNKALTKINPKMDLLLDPDSAQNVVKIGNVARYQQFQPRGSYVNNSNTLTGAVADAAKSGAEVGTNMMFGGVPVGSVIRKATQYVGKSKAVKESLGPAGMTNLSELPK